MSEHGLTTTSETRTEVEFSVLMSVYGNDRADWLGEAIESVVNQTLPPSEIVLVIDGPLPEETELVVRRWEDELGSTLVVHRLEKNSGLGMALREGAAIVSSELMARMDSDDIALPNRFAKQISFMVTHKKVDVLGGQIEEFDSVSGEPVGKRELPCEDNFIKRFMRKRCPFNHMTVMMRRDSLLKAGGYRSWPQNEDYDLWIRMLSSDCVFANLPDTLVKVRISPDTYARRGGIAYFKSELGIQQVLFRDGVISFPRFVINVAERFVLQVVMPNWARALVYKKFARVDA